jgi:hypothetical protein
MHKLLKRGGFPNPPDEVVASDNDGVASNENIRAGLLPHLFCARTILTRNIVCDDVDHGGLVTKEQQSYSS